jgi:hypothetical protein
MLRQRRDQVRALILAGGLAAALGAAGCSGGGAEASESTLPSGTTPRSSGTVEQPNVGDLPVAPASARVDLAVPTFSNPTEVTNPLFPVSSQASVLLLGRVDDKPFRTEVTLLPETRFILWEGQLVETLVSQYVAYLGGRIEEVAYDFYAQDDAGNVWYFGEDVFNFKDGAIADTHGTWIAGKDGPAAMIMPAHPEVGDVYRPENIPGFVFEEVTVKVTDETLDGPLGPVEGGLRIEELHMDGTKEDKTFAPGYGEFFTAGGGDVEALALAVPTDALSESASHELDTLRGGAMHVFDAAGSGDWSSARATVEQMASAWRTASAEPVPDRLAPRMTADLKALGEAVQKRDRARARQAGVDVARWTLDLELRHRPVTEIDLARFDLWAAQMLVDAAAGNAAAVNGDYFSLDYIRDRIQHTFREAERMRLNFILEELNGAVSEHDLEAAAKQAQKLRKTLAEFAS